uniref:NADH-ubiquinone oxidoreductase chain 5 n=1 Tax=Trigonopterus sp. 7 AH-2016 TaxID=1903841 RepID=A0A343C431_9CUCU|nr:NADH dehydrogenase subunit 5 [Trigonopterus sp. 7 AH-2016]
MMVNLSFYLFFVMSLVFYCLSLFFLFLNMEIYLEYSVFIMNSVSINLSIFFDWVSFIFSSFVLFISSMIMIYSKSYMQGDKSFNRFVFLMGLFVLSMLLVIMSSNLVFIFLGWDGLGLISFVLVIYYQNEKAYNSGMLTILSNRVGDVALLVSISLLMDKGGWSYTSIMDLMNKDEYMILMMFLIVLAALTKSAQMPFSSWLPAAMSAPTPVSSLVHSSTLVTAGVYLLFRFSMFLSMDIKISLMYFSLFTMFMAGLSANFEYDLKKIIALSTLSQLGFMMVIFFMGSENLAFFHLLIHALFKALLFMCAGVVIHSLGGWQDIRAMGGLAKVLPFTSTCFCISSMALCGLPFLSGFYSKDLIVEIYSMGITSSMSYIVFFLSIGLTVSYTVRLNYYVFMGRFNMYGVNYLGEASNEIMLKSMSGLVILVIFQGSLLSWVGFSSPYMVILPSYMKFMVLGMIFSGSFLGWELMKMEFLSNFKSLSFFQIFLFISSLWNLSFLTTLLLNKVFLNLGKIYVKNVDQGWLEYYGSKGLFHVLKNFIKFFQDLSLNHLKIYLLMLWMIFLLILVFLLE